MLALRLIVTVLVTSVCSIALADTTYRLERCTRFQDGVTLGFIGTRGQPRRMVIRPKGVEFSGDVKGVLRLSQVEELQLRPVLQITQTTGELVRFGPIDIRCQQLLRDVATPLVHVQSVRSVGDLVDARRFFLFVTDPCEQDNQAGPTGCKLEIRLVRKSDCREFKLQGEPNLRYCARSRGDQGPTPCEDLGGYDFHYGGLTYKSRDRLYAVNKMGKEISSEDARVIAYNAPSPTFHRIGNKCELRSAEIKR